MQSPTGLPTPAVSSRGPELHPAFYIISWILFSNVTIIFNKWLLDTAGFRYPILLTTIHLAFATALTHVLARTTHLLDSRHSLKLTGRLYLRAILPIGILYTLSLACSNVTYLYLSVPFIQMLKAFAPVSTLFISWAWGVSNPKVSVLYNVFIIAFGVLLSSIGEVRFSWLGFMFQMGGTLAESCRLLLIQILLAKEGEGLKMDPLVGLYYYAPVCAVLNGLVALCTEIPTFDWADLERVGLGMLGLNGLIAFGLNVASVCLIGKTSALAMNLTGILKSILLVLASLIIWQTPITLLQAVGYSIALGGMCYYSMGPEAARANLEKSKIWIRHASEVRSVPQFRRLFSARPEQYARVLASDEEAQRYESGDAESSRDSPLATPREKQEDGFRKD